MRHPNRTKAQHWRPSLGLVLLVLLLVSAACTGPAVLETPQAAAPTQTSSPATSAPTATQARPTAAAGQIPVGVDADGNFYRGDPSAPVKLVEFSDFQ